MKKIVWGVPIILLIAPLVSCGVTPHPSTHSASEPVQYVKNYQIGGRTFHTVLNTVLTNLGDSPASQWSSSSGNTVDITIGNHTAVFRVLSHGQVVAVNHYASSIWTVMAQTSAVYGSTHTITMPRGWHAEVQDVGCSVKPVTNTSQQGDYLSNDYSIKAEVFVPPWATAQKIEFILSRVSSQNPQHTVFMDATTVGASSGGISEVVLNHAIKGIGQYLGGATEFQLALVDESTAQLISALQFTTSADSCLQLLPPPPAPNVPVAPQPASLPDISAFQQALGNVKISPEYGTPPTGAVYNGATWWAITYFINNNPTTPSGESNGVALFENNQLVWPPSSWVKHYKFYNVIHVESIGVQNGKLVLLIHLISAGASGGSTTPQEIIFSPTTGFVVKSLATY